MATTINPTAPSNASHTYPQFDSEATRAAKKVIYYLGYVFAGFAQVVVTVLGAIPKLIIDLTFEKFHPNRAGNHIAALKSKINQAQLKNLKDAFQSLVDISDVKRKSDPEILKNRNALQNLISIKLDGIKNYETFEFIRLFNDIASLISKDDSEDNNVQANDIMERIGEITESKVYKALEKLGENHEGFRIVKILQQLAYTGMTADASAALKEYGKKIVGDLSQQNAFSFDQCAEIMDKIVNDGSMHNWNSPLSTIFWAICHPLEVWHAQGANWIPTEFDAHHGNPTFVDCTFAHPSDKSITVSHVLGPTPTNTGLYHAHLSHLESNGLRESRVSQQGPFPLPEQQRVVKLQSETRPFRKKGTLDFSIFSFDAPIMTTPSNFIDLKTLTPSSFIETYRKFVMDNNAHRTTTADPADDNGFNIPEKALSDERIKKAFETAKAAFDKIFQNNTFWNELSKTPAGKERLCRMMQLGVQAIMRADMIYQGLDNMKSDPNNPKLDIVAEACKQDVDRGPVLNISSRLFFRLLSDDSPLSKDELHSIIGTLVSRALMVDNRFIMAKRFVVLSDLLHFIGDQGEIQNIADMGTDSSNLKNLSDALKEHTGLLRKAKSASV